MQTVLDDNDKISRLCVPAASGYMLKKTPPQKMIDAVRETFQRGAPMTASVATKVQEMFRLQRDVTKNEFIDLSYREKEILSLLVKGKA
ncbi:MAG: hypothetical protein ABI477_17565 [Chryseolinea sp.]